MSDLVNEFYDTADKLIAQAQQLAEYDESEDSKRTMAELEKYRDLYNEAINNPCKHRKFNFVRAEKRIDLACACCNKVVKTYSSYAEAQKHIDFWQIAKPSD